MWETSNTFNISKLRAQRNWKHIQTSEYMLHLCLEYVFLLLSESIKIVQNCISARYFCININVSHSCGRKQADGVQEPGSGEGIWI
jgi:hypothetical protein